MRIDVLTLFPEMFSGYLGQSLLKRAIDAGIVDIQVHNIRDWAQGKHKQVDDRPFGALLLGYYEDGALKYAGHTCSGFNHRELERVIRLLKPLESERSPFDEKPN